MSHPWRSNGGKRTIAFKYTPDSAILEYLMDMRGLINKAILNAYSMAKSDGDRLPSPITLRRSLKKYYDGNMDYAKHHINPACRTAIAILKSCRKNNGRLRMVRAEKLAMRIDSELLKMEDNRLRITIRPNEYEYIDIVDKNKKFMEYSCYPLSEVLLTGNKVCITFKTCRDDKPVVDENIMGLDLNFKSVDYTIVKGNNVVEAGSIDTSSIAKAQRDYARKRTKIQKHIRNPEKRIRKLKESRHRQQNIVRDKLQKLTTMMVHNNKDRTFVFEDLTNIRKDGRKKKYRSGGRNSKRDEDKASNIGNNRSKRFRTDINRWPYGLFQRFVEYKSDNRTLYIDPEGTSSECPVCGGKLEHPVWKQSKCNTCGATFDRDRLASLSIAVRGLHLCGTPFTVSGSASWDFMKDDYLYHYGQVIIENPNACKK